MLEKTIGTDQILKQLEKILTSAAFEIASTKSAFLKYVVKKTLEGQRDSIKAYAIAVDALGLAESFNPEKDSRIRVMGVRLREALAVYYEGEGRHDPVIITLPPRSYAPVFKKNMLTHPPPKHAALRQEGLSVMVCPFAHHKSDRVQTAISDYLTEELSLCLGHFPELTVLPCPVVHPGPPDRIARFLIQGSILTSRQTVHIYIKLIETRSGRQLWARHFSKVPAEGVLAKLQNTVIRETIGTLGGVAGKILCIEAASPDKAITPEAAMALFTVLFRQPPSTALFYEIETALEKAIENAPQNATLHCMLAHQYIVGYFCGVYPDSSVIKKAENHIAMALMAEPDNAFARLMNTFHTIQSGLFEEARREIEAVLEQNENDVFLTTWSGYFLFMMGEFDRAEELIAAAEKINPFMARYNQIPYFHTHLVRGDYESALDVADRFYIPGFFWSPLLRAVALGLLGRKASAQRAVAKLLRLRPDLSENYPYYFQYIAPQSGPSRRLFLKGLDAAGLVLSRPVRIPAQDKAYHE